MKNQELMIHVEQIVRPLSATQVRKLRMRTELLTHLQATQEEEHHRFPGDERAALEQAKLRLGELGELTRQLQASVPVIERVFLGRLPLSRRMEELEVQMGYMPGQGGPMTMGHKLILSTIANFSFAPIFATMHSALTSVGMETTHPLVAFIGAPVGWYAILFLVYRFVFEAASSDAGSNLTVTMKRGAMIVALQIAMTFFLAAAIADRAASVSEVIISAVLTVAFLVIAILLSRRINVLKRPYDQWLTLQVAR